MKHFLYTAAIFAASVGLACEVPVESRTRPVPAVVAEKPAAPPLVRKDVAAIDAADKRTAVLLHGYGSNEDDLVGLARRVGLLGPVVSFRAPLPAGNGFAWFPIDFTPGGTRYEPRAADEPLRRLASEIGELRKKTDQSVIVLGFSQGAMLTMMLAAEHPDVVDAALEFSGALPRPVVAAPGAKPAVFAAHGTADPVVTYDRAQAALRNLEAIDANVEFHDYPGMKHSIGQQTVKDASTWLQRTCPANTGCRNP